MCVASWIERRPQGVYTTIYNGRLAVQEHSRQTNSRTSGTEGRRTKVARKMRDNSARRLQCHFSISISSSKEQVAKVSGDQRLPVKSRTRRHLDTTEVPSATGGAATRRVNWSFWLTAAPCLIILFWSATNKSPICNGDFATFIFLRQLLSLSNPRQFYCYIGIQNQSSRKFNTLVCCAGPELINNPKGPAHLALDGCSRGEAIDIGDIYYTAVDMLNKCSVTEIKNFSKYRGHWCNGNSTVFQISLFSLCTWQVTFFRFTYYFFEWEMQSRGKTSKIELIFLWRPNGFQDTAAWL